MLRVGMTTKCCGSDIWWDGVITTPLNESHRYERRLGTPVTGRNVEGFRIRVIGHRPPCFDSATARAVVDGNTGLRNHARLICHLACLWIDVDDVLITEIVY